MFASLTAVKSRLNDSRIVCLCYFYMNLDFGAGASLWSVASQISFYASGMRSKEEVSRRHMLCFTAIAPFSFSPLEFCLLSYFWHQRNDFNSKLVIFKLSNMYFWIFFHWWVWIEFLPARTRIRIGQMILLRACYSSYVSWKVYIYFIQRDKWIIYHLMPRQN